MKHTNFLATFLGLGCVGLCGMTAVAPVAQAQLHPRSATNCVVIRKGDFMAQEIYNRCDGAIEVTWCFYSDNNCVRFDSRTTIGAGRSYPIPAGQVLYSACAGANSIARTSGTSVQCS
jgi:hypothetical protein